MNRNVTATILVVLAIGIYFTITSTVLADAGKVQFVNAQYSSAIDTANKMLALQTKVESDYANLSANDKDRISKMVPSSVDNIRLIIDLNNVAAKHGFALQNIKAAAATAPTASLPTAPPVMAMSTDPNSPAGQLGTISTPTLDTVDISFSATAPYLQFISFLQDLEANLRIMDVVHLSMQASDTGVYTFTAELNTYWLRQN